MATIDLEFPYTSWPIPHEEGMETVEQCLKSRMTSTKTDYFLFNQTYTVIFNN